MNNDTRTIQPVLTLNYDGEDGKGRIEFYMLNPGKHFPGFGGSRSGLVVGKTASLVTRHVNVCLTDHERDIDDAFAWDLIRRAISGEFKCTATAQPVKED